MNPSFASKKLEKRCTQAKEMARAFNSNIANSLRMRMAEIKSADTVGQLRDGPGKWHWYGSDSIAASLTGNWRIVAYVGSRDDDATGLEVVSVKDYH